MDLIFKVFATLHGIKTNFVTYLIAFCMFLLTSISSGIKYLSRDNFRCFLSLNFCPVNIIEIISIQRTFPFKIPG